MKLMIAVLTLCLALTASVAIAAGNYPLAPGEAVGVDCPTALTGTIHAQHADLACASGPVHDASHWHAPTDHEHGDPPPQWIEQAGYTVAFDDHGGFHGNTSPAEDTLKHPGMKGFLANFNGVDLYVRIHIATNVLDRMARYHSYEIFARDPSGAVSHWQGWLNSGDPVADRVLYDGTNGRGNPPVVLGTDASQCALPKHICTETWYVLTAPWGPDIGWSAGATTWFYPGENEQPDRSNWRLSGDKGLNRRLEFSWYKGRAGGGTTLTGRFWATQFGTVVSGPSDPQCSSTTAQYGVSYKVICLEQTIAPTLPTVTFPGNSIVRVFPGRETVQIPN